MTTAMQRDAGGGLLLAVLLNPPGSTPGVRTRNAVERAARALRYDRAKIVNLSLTPTPSVIELNATPADQGWMQSRNALREALPDVDGVLGAWGVAGLTGAARRARDEQVAWLIAEMQLATVDRIWMVGGEPRHPSRWHQYVSDKYGRTSGGTFEERLAEVLIEMPLASL